MQDWRPCIPLYVQYPLRAIFLTDFVLVKCTSVSELCCSKNSLLVIDLQLYAAEWFERIISWAVSKPYSKL